MRVDSCRRCGEEMREFTQPEICAVCDRACEQFFCPKCDIATDPQYHTHQTALEASPLSH